jgi:hypothetical protein
VHAVASDATASLSDWHSAELDRFALAMAWSARNLGIATLVGVAILGRAELLVFTAAFFAAQAVLATAAVVGARVIATARRGAPAA